ncbi:MAG: hypothetical protein OEX02_21120, partial [Cyclobacteriaceae bacterium]|nr:hypothetical protein [Cyclobacteriaceae bacterium]
MRKSVNYLYILLMAGACMTSGPEVKITVLSAPAGDKYCEIVEKGTSVIPNGRLLTPAGRNIMVAPHPFGLKLSSDGDMAVTANSGTSPLSISIIKGLKSPNPTVLQIPPGPGTDKGILESVFMGIALSPDAGRVYVSGGQSNKIIIFDTANGTKLDSIDCSRAADGYSVTDG